MKWLVHKFFDRRVAIIVDSVTEENMSYGGGAGASGAHTKCTYFSAKNECFEGDYAKMRFTAANCKKFKVVCSDYKVFQNLINQFK